MNPIDYLDVVTRIARDGIHFGNEKVPGLIAEDGIVLKPGVAPTTSTKLTVTFLVGPVIVDDCISETTVETPAETANVMSVRRDIARQSAALRPTP